jgi:acyl-CoA synthetase (AMP-forming)/AMP-acid ligase II
VSKDARHLGRLLRAAASAFAERAAIMDQRGRAFTYAELDRAADRLATRLARWGVGRGDRVGLSLPCTVESIVSIHAILRTGAAYVAVDSRMTPDDVARSFATAHVRAAVVPDSHGDGVRQTWPGQGPPPRLIVVGPASALRPGDASFQAIQADDAPTPRFVDPAPGDPGCVLLESEAGLTPALLRLTQAQMMAWLDASDPSASTGSDITPEMARIAGLDLLRSCRNGATIRIPPIAGVSSEPPDPRDAAEIRFATRRPSIIAMGGHQKPYPPSHVVSDPPRPASASLAGSPRDDAAPDP